MLSWLNNKNKYLPWTWIPTLYFTQSIPYATVMTISVILYKRLGISNTDIALYTSWLYLPWVIKPLWSPFIDLFKTKRFWTVYMQLLISVCLAFVAFFLNLPFFFQTTLALFWLMAFSSATHDISADGYYMLALQENQQAAFVGVRSTFYRLANILTQGGLVILAGYLEQKGFSLSWAWTLTFLVLATLFASLFLYHYFILPFPEKDTAQKQESSSNVWKDYFQVFALFFKKKDIIPILLFLLFFRFAEAQLVKLITPFLLDLPESGGLNLTTSEVGWIYGTVGIFFLVLGGILGGYAISRKGLKYWLWIMVLSIHLPDLVFILLSKFHPHSHFLIQAAVALEQFGYGFGFTAYMMSMIYFAEGEHKTAHYAICTGFMALGMMLPGMLSGWMQEQIGYQYFFIWVALSTLPGFIVPVFIKIPADFGKKAQL